jgi:hypothetical protein
MNERAFLKAFMVMNCFILFSRLKRYQKKRNTVKFRRNTGGGFFWGESDNFEWKYSCPSLSALSLSTDLLFEVLNIRGFVIVYKIRYPQIFPPVIRGFCPFLMAIWKIRYQNSYPWLYAVLVFAGYSDIYTPANKDGCLYSQTWLQQTLLKYRHTFVISNSEIDITLNVYVVKPTPGGKKVEL